MAFKLAPNLAAEIDVKYIDMVPGQHGSQIRLKGTIDGSQETDVVYLPGSLADAATILVKAGVIGHKDYPAEVEKATAITPIKRKLTLLAQQPAGQKYPSLLVNGFGLDNGAGSQAAAASGAAKGNGHTEPVASEGESNGKTLLGPLYGSITDYVLENIVPKYVEKEIGVSAEAVSSMVATLFIARTRQLGI